MTYDLPSTLSDLAQRQHGVITRRQALAAGMSQDLVESWLGRGRWQRLHTGVYATFSGQPERTAWLWAAVLRAGRGAALSHLTAAELDRLTDRPPTTIHLTIPATRRVLPITGAVVHLRHDAETATHPARLPPRIRIEETVFDLAEQCDQMWDAVGWISAALGRRLTTQERLRETMQARGRIRWRKELAPLLSPGLGGICSVLEYRYVRHVEQPHGLPVSKRQERSALGRRAAYRDVLYEAYGLAVELDGRVAHPGDARWQDIWRDNASAAGGIITLRYGYRDVVAAPCLVATQVSAVLRIRGWPGVPRACAAGCAVLQSAS